MPTLYVQRSALPLAKPHNFIHHDDHLILEDESGRVKLSGPVLAPAAFVTGLTLKNIYPKILMLKFNSTVDIDGSFLSSM